MSRTKLALAALALTALALTGCSPKKADTPAAALPDAKQLLAEGTAAMAQVTTAHFVIDVDGKISGLSLKHADGDLTAKGEAAGTVKIEQFGTLVEAKFVIVGTSAYMQGPTGKYLEFPLATAASIYDPSAILDPQRGVAKVLSTVKSATTEARETVDGHDSFKVKVEPDQAALAGLIPNAPAGVTGFLWLDAATKQLVKGEFNLPASGSDPAGKVTVEFSKYNDPVTVTKP
ncbi:hypothetical protein Cs7R123_70020 [Catellatospora sp. TT07R-123]|uniref:LppX_LprAFG lipoprotein n=1 Tax=Catellatospora sp. TT07R-123 TaxID=2733863 RepID=UPI001B119A00|nr:LppX_LprAFG lipoprotein [Catellatospora sp. TT07R-123]GHJ49660.1 hypothetical protein Cs7R123_70020 [Catellatospora sp. TT07R-123]